MILYDKSAVLQEVNLNAAQDKEQQLQEREVAGARAHSVSCECWHLAAITYNASKGVCPVRFDNFVNPQISN